MNTPTLPKAPIILTSIVTIIFVSLIGGWAVMILAGAAHVLWPLTVPAAGYWASVVLAAAVRLSRVLWK